MFESLIFAENPYEGAGSRLEKMFSLITHSLDGGDA
jgi:hypothetical protein